MEGNIIASNNGKFYDLRKMTPLFSSPSYASYYEAYLGHESFKEAGQVVPQAYIDRIEQHYIPRLQRDIERKLSACLNR